MGTPVPTDRERRHWEGVASTYDEEIRRFNDLARTLCQIFDTRQRSDTHRFLLSLDASLAALYAASRQLPESDFWFVDDDDDAQSDSTDGFASSAELTRGKVAAYLEVYRPLFDQLDAELGELARYRGLFDPYPGLPGSVAPDGAANEGFLADDLASIYVHMREHLALVDIGSAEALKEACWETRFEFDGHLGQHLTAAIRAVWAALYQHDELWEDDARDLEP
jgi:hypothetical protein